MVDQQLTCATCGQRFPWTVGEQRFFRERGLERPRRCPACREARKAQVAPPARRPASPQHIFGVATLAAALALSLALLLLTRSAPLLAWLFAANIVAFLAYGYDKLIAGGRWLRVPERVLLGLALAGGCLGEANCLSSQGQLRLLEGAQQEADELLQEAITIYEAIDDRYSVAAQIGNYDLALHHIGRNDLAQPYLERAANLFAEMGLDDYAEQLRQAAG